VLLAELPLAGDGKRKEVFKFEHKAKSAGITENANFNDNQHD
jgi:hypothetical protein